MEQNKHKKGNMSAEDYELKKRQVIFVKRIFSIINSFFMMIEFSILTYGLEYLFGRFVENDGSSGQLVKISSLLGQLIISISWMGYRYAGSKFSLIIQSIGTLKGVFLQMIQINHLTKSSIFYFIYMYLDFYIVKTYLPPSVVNDESTIVHEQSWYKIISVCIAAPVLEEFVFRFLLLGNLQQNFATVSAIIWHCFFFGMIHISNFILGLAPWKYVALSIVDAFLLAVFLGDVTVQSKNLTSAIWIHMLNNYCSLNALPIDSFGETTPVVLKTSIAIHIVILTIMSISILRKYRKQAKKA